MPPKIPASVTILTFNSAATLGRALESVKDFDDLLVCDGGSTDGTLEIAARYGARVIPQDPDAAEPHPIRDYSVVRNRCMEHARHDWILYIDSDETAEPELVEEIRAIVAKDEPGVRLYRVSPRIILQGKRIDHSTAYPGYQYRFFKRGPGLRFIRAVHERLAPPPDAFIGEVKGHWNYYLRGPDEITEDVFTRDIPRLLMRYAGKDWRVRLRGMRKAGRRVVGIFAKYAWIAFWYRRGAAVMPWEVERARIWVQWQYIKALWRSIWRPTV